MGRLAAAGLLVLPRALGRGLTSPTVAGGGLDLTDGLVGEDRRESSESKLRDLSLSLSIIFIAVFMLEGSSSRIVADGCAVGRGRRKEAPEDPALSLSRSSIALRKLASSSSLALIVAWTASDWFGVLWGASVPVADT